MSVSRPPPGHSASSNLPPPLLLGETELRGQYDITKVDLHPSEQYKSVSSTESDLSSDSQLSAVHMHVCPLQMVLAGHRPDTIIEICSRALSFWTYQVTWHTKSSSSLLPASFPLLLQSHQERAYQEYCASKAIEKAQEQESYYEQALAVHTSEIACIPPHQRIISTLLAA